MMGLLDAGVAILLTTVSCVPGVGAKSRVRFSAKPVALKPWVASGTPAAESGVTMPPMPGVKVTVPPLPSRPVPVPASSMMIWPGPAGSWTTTVNAPAVVAGVAVVKVMLPVWLLSPTVIVPVAVV